MNYSFQRIGEYKESEQAKTLAHRDYKDATDLIIRGGVRHGYYSKKTHTN